MFRQRMLMRNPVHKTLTRTAMQLQLVEMNLFLLVSIVGLWAAASPVQARNEAPRCRRDPEQPLDVEPGFRGPFRKGIHYCGRLKNIKFEQYLMLNPENQLVIAERAGSDASNPAPFDWIFVKAGSLFNILTRDGTRSLFADKESRSSGHRRVLAAPHFDKNADKEDTWFLEIKFKSGSRLIRHDKLRENLWAEDQLNQDGSRNVYLWNEDTKEAASQARDQSRWIIELVDCPSA